MLALSKVFLFIVVATLILSVVCLIFWYGCLLILFSGEIVVSFVFCLCVIFRGAICKFLGDANNLLEETDYLWLVAISPFHKLSSWRHSMLRGIRGKMLIVSLAVVELILFPLSLIGGAAMETPEAFQDMFL